MVMKTRERAMGVGKARAVSEAVCCANHVCNSRFCHIPTCKHACTCMQTQMWRFNSTGKQHNSVDIQRRDAQHKRKELHEDLLAKLSMTLVAGKVSGEVYLPSQERKVASRPEVPCFGSTQALNRLS